MCCLVLRSNFAPLLTIQFALGFFFFFCHNFFPPIFFFFLFSRAEICIFFCRDFFFFIIIIIVIIIIFLFFIFSPRFFFLFIYLFIYLFYLFFFFFPATILSGPFASLISSLINIISLLLTTFDWTKVRGIAPRSHTGRPRTCLVSSMAAVNWDRLSAATVL